jgi:dTDP-4-amino-4,6-dideoxygalactose transaminase
MASLTNPYMQLAATTLAALEKIDDVVERRQALALVLAQAAVKAQESFRQRVWKLEMPLTFERYVVERLDNSSAYMQIEMAKAVGLAVLRNDKLCQLRKEQTETEVKFTSACALVPKEEWTA